MSIWYSRVLLPTSLLFCCAVGCVIKRKKQMKRMIHAEQMFRMRANMARNGSQAERPMENRYHGMLDQHMFIVTDNTFCQRLPPPYTEHDGTTNPPNGYNHLTTGLRDSSVENNDPPPSYSSIFTWIFDVNLWGNVFILKYMLIFCLLLCVNPVIRCWWIQWFLTLKI